MLLALKVSPFFISSVQPPQWADMKGTAECYKDGVVFAICVNLTCFSVFTERSVPKLWGPTLSEMNNLFIITLNLLSCYNCLSNILPDFFSGADMTRIKVMLACLFHSGKTKKKSFLMTLTFSGFRDEACKAFACEAQMSSHPSEGCQWLWLFIFKQYKWIQSSHGLAFLAFCLDLLNNLVESVKACSPAPRHSATSRTV